MKTLVRGSLNTYMERAVSSFRHHRTVAFKLAVSAWILFYYTFALIHQWPDCPLIIKLREPTRTVAEYLGWVQNWHLFGPVIRQINFHTIALIGYKDGSVGSWEPPRFELLTLKQKYCKDKFHKWDSDCLAWFNYRDFWPDFARYIGRLHYQATNPPEWLMLLRYEADIPDPRVGLVVEHDRMPPHTRLLNSFTYHFSQEDFK